MAATLISLVDCVDSPPINTEQTVTKFDKGDNLLGDASDQRNVTRSPIMALNNKIYKISGTIQFPAFGFLKRLGMHG